MCACQYVTSAVFAALDVLMCPAFGTHVCPCSVTPGRHQLQPRLPQRPHERVRAAQPVERQLQPGADGGLEPRCVRVFVRACACLGNVSRKRAHCSSVHDGHHGTARLAQHTAHQTRPAPASAPGRHCHTPAAGTLNPAAPCPAYWEGIACDLETGRVTGINLAGRVLACGASCQLHPQLLATLTALQHLKLAGTSFAVQLSSIGSSLALLQTLDLSYAPNVQEPLPPSWPEQLPWLVELRLSGLANLVGVRACVVALLTCWRRCAVSPKTQLPVAAACAMHRRGTCRRPGSTAARGTRRSRRGTWRTAAQHWCRPGPGCSARFSASTSAAQLSVAPWVMRLPATS